MAQTENAPALVLAAGPESTNWPANDDGLEAGNEPAGQAPRRRRRCNILETALCADAGALINWLAGPATFSGEQMLPH